MPSHHIMATMVAALAAALLTIAAATSAAAITAAASFSPHLTRAPYLTDLVGLTVNVNFATDQSAKAATVSYGAVTFAGCTLTTTMPTTRRSVTVGTVHEYQWNAQITLPDAGTYCYRPFLGDVDLLGTTPSPRFITQQQPDDTAPFTFDVMGDWGLVNQAGDNPDEANLMHQIAASNARFMVTVGDNGYPNGNQINYGDLQQTGAGTSAIFGPDFWTVAGMSTPIFTAGGNHGLSGTTHTDLTTWTQDTAVAESGGRYQDDVYCCVNDTLSSHYASEWYAFTAGNARFYILDAAWGDTNKGTATTYANDAAAHWSPGDPEYEWLRSDLQSHPTALKFAFFHYPLYADNPHESSDTYLNGPDHLEGLLASNGVQLVFNGHAHLYQRNRPSAPGMPISYVTGGGGGTLEPVGPCSGIDAYARGWSPTKSKGTACGGAAPATTAAEVYHFLKVTVSGATVTVTPTDSLGHTFDAQTYRFPDSLYPPPTPVFADGFESGDLSRWTSTAGLTVQGADVHTGTHAAEADTTNGLTYARKDLPSSYPNAFAQAYFSIVSQSSQVNLLRLRDASGTSLGYAYVTSTGRLGLHNDATGASTTSAVTVSPGWHALQLHREADATAGTPSGTLQVSLDGATVADLSSTAVDTGTSPVGGIQIGEVQTGRTYRVAFDDVSFATSQAALSTAATTARATSSGAGAPMDTR